MSKLGVIGIPNAKMLEPMWVVDGIASIKCSICCGTYRDMAADITWCSKGTALLSEKTDTIIPNVFYFGKVI